MRAPHRFGIALGERCRRLDRRRVELLPPDLLPPFPCLASPLPPGPGARARANLRQGEEPPGISDGAERRYVLVAAHSRLSAAGGRRSAPSPVCAGASAARDRIVDVGALGD